MSRKFRKTRVREVPNCGWFNVYRKERFH